MTRADCSVSLPTCLTAFIALIADAYNMSFLKLKSIRCKQMRWQDESETDIWFNQFVNSSVSPYCKMKTVTVQGNSRNNATSSRENTIEGQSMGMWIWVFSWDSEDWQIHICM